MGGPSVSEYYDILYFVLDSEFQVEENRALIDPTTCSPGG